MAIESVSYSAAQSGAEVVPGHAGEAIRILMVLATCWTNARITLLSEPGGDHQRAITAPLHFGGGQPLLFRLGRHYALPLDAEKALGVTTGYESTVAPVSLTIWFERVPT